jgi:hypothetical protein
MTDINSAPELKRRLAELQKPDVDAECARLRELVRDLCDAVHSDQVRLPERVNVAISFDLRGFQCTASMSGADEAELLARLNHLAGMLAAGR